MCIHMNRNHYEMITRLYLLCANVVFQHDDNQVVIYEEAVQDELVHYIPNYHYYETLNSKESI